MPSAEFRSLLLSVAGDFANVPGCEWKICLIDEEKNEGGAVYLFTDVDALSTFKESPLVQSVLAHPGLDNFVFRETDVVVDASIVTRAPLAATMVA